MDVVWKIGETILINKSLLRLWQHIDYARRKSLLALLCLLVCASVAEVVTIGAIIPFLSVLTDPVGFYSNPTVGSMAGSFGITHPDELIFPMVIMFGLAAVASGVIRLALLIFSNKINSINKQANSSNSSETSRSSNNNNIFYIIIIQIIIF